MPHDRINVPFEASTARKRPAARLVTAIFVLAICFCAICTKVLIDARRATWDRAAEVATGLLATIAADITRNIESYDLSLNAVIENLHIPEISRVSPELRQRFMFDRSTTAKHLDALSLIDENGIVRFDSRTPNPAPTDRSNREYYQFHKNNNISGLHISQPFVPASTGNHVVAVTRRISNADGSFAGVVVGTLRLSYIQQMFKEAALGPHGSITLVRMDGVLLARWPYQPSMIGFSLNGGEILKHLTEAPRGQFETDSAATDGVHRFYVYSQLGDLPLAIGVGQSTADIDAPWQRYAMYIGLLMVLLCSMSIILALYLGREMKRRDLAEAILADLATTDSLTGLSNRRYFNEALDREWQRAARERTPLSLMMIDTDLFKGYNDTHGHQVGDKLLQAIGTAMKQSVRRATDVAARYGGDEFAILLPATSDDKASQVAEQVRNRLPEVCDEKGIARSHLSMGVASLVPMPGDDCSSLVAAADIALYRAKELGRNQVTIAPTRATKPALISNSYQHSAA